MNYDDSRKVLMRMQNDRQIAPQNRNKLGGVIRYLEETEKRLSYFEKKYPHPYPDEL